MGYKKKDYLHTIMSVVDFFRSPCPSTQPCSFSCAHLRFRVLESPPFFCRLLALHCNLPPSGNGINGKKRYVKERVNLW